MTDEQPILAMSVSADFYPGLGEGDCDTYDGNSIEWTFALPRTATVGAGIYEVRFIRTLAEEEALGFPLLGGPRAKPTDTDAG